MNILIDLLVIFFLTSTDGVVYDHALNTAEELRFDKPFVFWLLWMCRGVGLHYFVGHEVYPEGPLFHTSWLFVCAPLYTMFKGISKLSNCTFPQEQSCWQFCPPIIFLTWLLFPHKCQQQ